MVQETLMARQAMALVRRSGEPLIETLEDILKTPAVSQPLELMGGPDQEEERLLFPSFGYYLDESARDILVLRRQHGAFVAAFSAKGATREGIVEAAREDGGVGWGERGPSGHDLRKAPQRLSGERGLFSGVRGRVILLSSRRAWGTGIMIT